MTSTIPTRLVNALRLVTLAVLVFPVRSSAQTTPVSRPRDYRIDAGHSLVEFSIPFLYGKVRGRFDNVRGTLLVDERDLTNSSLTVLVDVRSIATGSAHRDEHLKSDDFFDVQKFPMARFESRAIQRVPSGFVAIGAFTLHGVTKEIRIPFQQMHAPVADPHGSRIVGYAGTLKLARKDFGIMGGEKHNEWFDAVRSATMGDTAKSVLVMTTLGDVLERDGDAVKARSMYVNALVIDPGDTRASEFLRRMPR